jgi:MFS family permease
VERRQRLALGGVGWMFHAGYHGLPLLAAILLFIGAFAMALGPIPWILCSEIFPTKVRGRAMSLATFTIWTSCYLVAQTFPMLNDNPAIGPAKAFWIYALCSLADVDFNGLLVWVHALKLRPNGGVCVIHGSKPQRCGAGRCEHIGNICRFNQPVAVQINRAGMMLPKSIAVDGQARTERNDKSKAWKPRPPKDSPAASRPRFPSTPRTSNFRRRTVARSNN